MIVNKAGWRASVLALLAAGAILPGAACAETLSEAIASAYESNPNILAQRAAVRGLDENYVQARAGFGLQASGSISGAYTYYESDAFSSRDSDRANHSDSKQITLSQPLYTGGRLTARLRAAEAQIKAARESLRRAELELLTRVVGVYAAVRRDEQILRISQEAVALLAKQLQDSEDKYAVRQVTLTDVQQSRARYAQAKTQLATAQGQLNVSRAEYTAVVGHAPVDLQPEPDLKGLPADLDAAFDLAEMNNPALLQALYVEAGSSARLAEARAARMPSISGRLEWQRGPLEAYANNNEGFERFAASVSLSQPIYSSGQISSGIRQSLQENARDQHLIDDARRNMILSVSQAWNQLAVSRKTLVSLEEEMQADMLALYGVREEERFALRSTIEILNAQAELQSAQTNYLRQRYFEYLGRAQLLALIGVLRPETLSSEVTAYDPTKNFKDVHWKGALPTEIVPRVLDRVAQPQLDKPKAGDTTPIRPPSTTLPDAPVEAAKAKPLPSATQLGDPRDAETPVATKPN